MTLTFDFQMIVCFILSISIYLFALQPKTILTFFMLTGFFLVWSSDQLGGTKSEIDKNVQGVPQP